MDRRVQLVACCGYTEIRSHRATECNAQDVQWIFAYKFSTKHNQTQIHTPSHTITAAVDINVLDLSLCLRASFSIWYFWVPSTVREFWCWWRHWWWPTHIGYKFTRTWHNLSHNLNKYHAIMRHICDKITKSSKTQEKRNNKKTWKQINNMHNNNNNNSKWIE